MGGRSAESASGVPRSAPTMLTQATTRAVSSDASKRERASAASAPDLLAVTTMRPPSSGRAARTAAAMAAALSSIEALSPVAMSRWARPSRSRSLRWCAKSAPVSGWLR